MSKQTVSQETRFPIPEFDDVEIAFGAPGYAYATRDEIGDLYGLMQSNPFCKAASGLFFQGGKLSDYGLKWKDGVDEAKGMRAVQALLSSWAPKHEIKEGTVALMLSEHCDLIGKAKP